MSRIPRMIARALRHEPELLGLTINNGKAPYFSAGMRVIGEAAISP